METTIPFKVYGLRLRGRGGGARRFRLEKKMETAVIFDV